MLGSSSRKNRSISQIIAQYQHAIHLTYQDISFRENTTYFNTVLEELIQELKNSGWDEVQISNLISTIKND